MRRDLRLACCLLAVLCAPWTGCSSPEPVVYLEPGQLLSGQFRNLVAGASQVDGAFHPRRAPPASRKRGCQTPETTSGFRLSPRTWR